MKKKIIAIFFLINTLTLFAQEIEGKLKELQEMKLQGMISEEDYQILRQEITGEEVEKEEYYDLSINSKLVSNMYQIIKKDNKIYVPVKEFFKYLGFSNYKLDKNLLIVYLGSSLREEKIDLTKDGFKESEEFYIELGRFKEVFLSEYEIDEKRMKLRYYLSFDTPKEIIRLVDINREKLLKKEEKNELVFSSKRKMFDLGYTRIQLGKTFEKEAGKSKYKNNWDGSLGYQGGLLYGEITADYDLDENELNTVRLDYDNIWQGHNLDIENRRNDKSREWGVQFYKDRSFYEDFGGEIVITERVPIGSRVELLYMGTPIDIQDDDNGIVEFSNPLIRTDRTYVLKIYEPDGRIVEREIKTVKDYYLQKKGEIEYRVGINERKQYDRFETDAKFFYGISDKLTLGFGYGRNIEVISSYENGDSVEHVNDVTADLVYGGTYNGLSYTFNLSGEKTLDNLSVYKSRDGEDKKLSMSDRYKYKYLNQFNYKKWKLIYEHEEYGEYYDENERNSLDLEYDIFNNFRLGYEWEKTEYRNVINKNSERERKFTADADYSWKNFLFSFGTSQDIEDSRNNEYRASVYYNGWQTLTGRLENVWTKDGEEYETKLNIYNNNYKGFLDFSTELAYSNKDKERVTFSITVKLDDWLKLDTTLSDDGARSHRIGIDKVVDLKNPTKRIDSLDSSRVRVVTFVDKNDNNIWDEGEERVEGVEVRIGDTTIVTDENGEGMFYGIGNGTIYELKTTIKKPSFVIGDNILKVKSNFSSTVDAYIPIKPMLTLSGEIVLDEILNLKDDEKEEFYGELVIELKDLNGEVIETAIPDNEGLFDISGLFPKDYYIDVTYIGTKYDLKTIREEIELQYSKDNSVNQVMLKISNKTIAVEMTDNKLAKLGR